VWERVSVESYQRRLEGPSKRRGDQERERCFEEKGVLVWNGPGLSFTDGGQSRVGNVVVPGYTECQLKMKWERTCVRLEHAG